MLAGAWFSSLLERGSGVLRPTIGTGNLVTFCPYAVGQNKSQPSPEEKCGDIGSTHCETKGYGCREGVEEGPVVFLPLVSALVTILQYRPVVPCE